MNETIASIIREKREMAAEIRAHLSIVPARREEQLLEADSLDREADRLEAARHTSGNAAAIREALEALVAYWDWGGYDAMRESRLKDMARAALSAPARQCDVGTAEEQDARFGEFCVIRRTGSCAGCSGSVGSFTVANGIRECALVWAQMPYKVQEGGAK